MRIGTNVPNELLQRVKQADPNINVSQLFRAALEDFASKSEWAREFGFANVQDMEQAAKNLLETDDMPLVEPDWFGYGLEDSRDWASTVSIEDWKRFWHEYDLISNRDGQEEAANWVRFARMPDGAKVFHDHRVNHEEYLNRMWDNNIYFSVSDCESIYNHGWMSHALEVRQLYEEYREAKRERLLDERRQKWQSLPDPGVPQQLLD